MPVLEAMWVETSYNGTAMLASRVRLVRATAVHKWLVNTKFPGSLYEFTVARGGEPDSRGSSELELREMLSSTRTEHVRHGLGGMAKELLQESPILRKVFSGPTLVWGIFFSGQAAWWTASRVAGAPAARSCRTMQHVAARPVGATTTTATAAAVAAWPRWS